MSKKLRLTGRASFGSPLLPRIGLLRNQVVLVDDATGTQLQALMNKDADPDVPVFTLLSGSEAVTYDLTLGVAPTPQFDGSMMVDPARLASLPYRIPKGTVLRDVNLVPYGWSDGVGGYSGTAGALRLVYQSKAVGSVWTAALAPGWTVSGRQWTKNGVDIAGQTALTYTLVSGDVNAEIGCRAAGAAFTAVAVASVAPVAPVAPPTPPVVDTRPRFFVAPASAYTTGTQGFLSGATALTGSTNGGKAGSFSLTTTAGSYGWVAVLAASSGAPGVFFNDGVGDGGWSGAGQAGNSASGVTQNTSTTLFTDSNGTQWRLFRQDFVNANPSAASYTIR